MNPSSESADDSYYWHIRLHKRKTQNWLLALGGLLLLVASAYIALDSRDMYERRAHASEALTAPIELQQIISQQLENTPHATIEIEASVTDKIWKGVAVAVSRDGTIMVFSQRAGAVFVLRPLVGADSKVEWTCWGNSIYGNNAIPGWCRKRQPKDDAIPH